MNCTYIDKFADLALTVRANIIRLTYLMYVINLFNVQLTKS